MTSQNISQIPGMHTVVSAVYDVSVGEVWSRESIAGLKRQIEASNLHFEVVESIPVHEDIKLGKSTRDGYIENYCENIRRVAEYRSMTEESLWDNLQYFLERIIPVSVECGVNMAIHEDDPC